MISTLSKDTVLALCGMPNHSVNKFLIESATLKSILEEEESVGSNKHLLKLSSQPDTSSSTCVTADNSAINLFSRCDKNKSESIF